MAPGSTSLTAHRNTERLPRPCSELNTMLLGRVPKNVDREGVPPRGAGTAGTLRSNRAAISYRFGPTPADAGDGNEIAPPRPPALSPAPQESKDANAGALAAPPIDSWPRPERTRHAPMPGPRAEHARGAPVNTARMGARTARAGTAARAPGNRAAPGAAGVAGALVLAPADIRGGTPPNTISPARHPRLVSPKFKSHPLRRPNSTPPRTPSKAPTFRTHPSLPTHLCEPPGTNAPNQTALPLPSAPPPPQPTPLTAQSLL